MNYKSILQFAITLFLLSLAQAIQVTKIPSTGSPPEKRKQTSAAYDSVAEQIYIYGGYLDSVEFTGDLWMFDLKTKSWQEITSPSVNSPGARMSSFIHIFPERREMILFGGKNAYGPISDMWKFDIVNQMVRIIQWREVITDGMPISTFRNAICAFNYQDRDFIATMGGNSRNGFINNLYLYDVELNTWTELLTTGTLPEANESGQIQYHNGALYFFGGNDYVGPLDVNLYKLDLLTSEWSVVSMLSSERPYGRIMGGSAIIGSYYYIIGGYCNDLYRDIPDIWRVDLSIYPTEWEYISMQHDPYYEQLARDGFGYAFSDSKVYIFGGWTYNGIKNDLLELDPSKFYEGATPFQWKILSELAVIPTARVGHAMEVYNENLYILGGKNKQGKKYKICSIIDIWKFNIKEETWSPQLVQSIEPSGRSEFSHTKSGDILVIFGGLGDAGLLDDMYTLNLSNNLWTLVDIKSKSKPSPRKGACMAACGPVFYIFGGITNAGYVNELWKFDPGTGEYTELSTLGERPPPSAYSKCEATYIENESVTFRMMFGEITGRTPLSVIYEYNASNNKWTPIYDKGFEYQSRSDGTVQKLGSKLILAGGHQWSDVSYSDIHMLDLVSQQYTYLGELPMMSFSAASSYFNDVIYIHGGGGSFGTLTRASVPMNDLILLDLNSDCKEEKCMWPCSKGSYLNKNKVCTGCGTGEYTEYIGFSECVPCPPGYYSKTSGSDSFRQCHPCPDGYYNSKPGQSTCLMCPYGMECPIGSVNPKVNYNLNQAYISTQPKLYSEKADEVTANILYLEIVLGLLYAFILLVFISTSKTRRLLNTLDFYVYQHNHFINKPMYVRKTIIGGTFTLAFLALAFFLISNTAMNYSLDNIVEQKALVPLVALEQDYGNIQAQEMIFEYTFKNYGGECAIDDKCASGISIFQDYLEGKFSDPVCEKKSSDCFVRAVCKNCELTNTGSTTIVMSESQSFAAEIYVNVTTSSSIPEEVSSIFTVITAEENTIFRGIEPTIVYLLVTPSVFLSQVSDWASELTGYHIAQSRDPIKGSLINTSDIPFTKNLKVTIMLDKNQSALLTNRNEKQTLYILLSSLAGSIIGVMGGLGFLMRNFEKAVERMLNRKDKKKKLMNSINNRIWLDNVLNDGNSPGENRDHYSIVMPQICDASNASLIHHRAIDTGKSDKSYLSSSKDHRYMIDDLDHTYDVSRFTPTLSRDLSQTTFRTNRSIYNPKVHPIG